MSAVKSYDAIIVGPLAQRFGAAIELARSSCALVFMGEHNHGRAHSAKLTLSDFVQICLGTSEKESFLKMKP